MNSLLESAEVWFRDIIILSSKGTLFALIVGLLLVLLRRQLSPGWRHGLWLLVLLRFTLPDMGESRLSMARVFDIPSVKAAQQVEIIEARVQMTEPEALALAEEVPSPVVDASAISTISGVSPWTLWQKLTLGWLAGVVTMLGTMLILHVRLLRRVRADGEAPSPWVQSLLREACDMAKAGRMPRLRVTDAVRAPALFGAWRPMILLPREVAKECDSASLKLILLHEIAHLQRRDLWTQIFASLILVVQWFNPLAWWAGRRLRVEAEMAADARALRYTDAAEAHRFGSMLLGFANGAMTGWLLWLSSATLLGISENKHDLKRRIEALKDVAGRRRTRWMIGFLAFALLAVSGLTQTPAPSSTTTVTTTVTTTTSAAVGGTTVTGIVVDDHGKPVAGASCSLRIGAEEDPEVRKATSDAEGRFRFESVPESSSLQLRALHPDYVSPRELPPKFSGQDQKEHRLVLTKATSWVTGTVTRKADGQPVANAAVYVTVAYDSSLIGLIGGRAKARTDVKGQFRVAKSSYDKEKGNIWVDAPGMALNVGPFTWKEGGQTIDHALEPEQLLTGKVVDADGKPVKDASLSLSGRLYMETSSRLKIPDSGYYSVGSGYWMGEPMSDAQGAFSSRVLITSTEDQWFVVQHPTAGIRYIRLRDWKSGDTLKLERWSSAQGRVVDQNDKPVADAEIRFSSGVREKNADGTTAFSLSHRAVAKTDAQGNYSQDRIPPHSISDYVTVNGKLVLLSRSEFEPGVTKTVDIRLPASRTPGTPVPAEKTRQVQGRVLMPSGRPVMSDAWSTRMSITALSKGGINDQPDIDNSGRFETRSLPVGDYLLSAWVSPNDRKLISASKSGFSLAFKVEADAARKPLDLGEFKLVESDFAFRPSTYRSPTTWQTMKLNAPVEDAAAYATWVASNGRGPGPEQRFTDGRAAGEGSHDTNRRFLIRATKATGSRYFSTAQVADEKEGTVFDKPVSLAPAVAVRGRLRGLPADYKGDGWIIAGVAVRASVKLGEVIKGAVPVANWYAWASVTREGAFEFPALPRGSLTLQGFGEGWSTLTPYQTASPLSMSLTGEQSPVEFVIDTAPCIERRVRLLRPDGSPAAGAKLVLQTGSNAVPLVLTSRGHAVEPADAEAYARYKKLRIQGHSVVANADGLAVLQNQLDMPYGTTSCEVKWTDPQTRAEHRERVSIANDARQPQEIKLIGKAP